MNKNKRQPNLWNDDKECSGCSACAAVCPVKAINFRYNSEGFLYPEVDSGKCIRCLKCERVCAYKKDTVTVIAEKRNTHIYAAKTRDENVLKSSSSGGMFTVLSDLFLDKNDMVVSCIYSYEKEAVVFSFFNNKSARDEAKGSKYIQAEAGNAFENIMAWLSQNPDRNMLIVGTGCQIAGLDLLLKEKKLRGRVLLVDLICHGVASSKLWKDFAAKKEKEHGGRINYITFKNKRNGWENPSTFIKIKDEELSIKPFADWFYMGWTLRESCYNCPYTKIDRNSDITIGDFWGIQNVMPDFYDKMGVSLVITHSEKGEIVFNEVKSKINFRESNRTECLQPRLIKPQVRPENRDDFWRDMNQNGMEYCEKIYFEYHRTTLKMKIKMAIKKIIKR